MHKKCLMRIILLFSIFLVTKSNANDLVKHYNVNKMISIADIHFDPFLDCKKDQFPCPLLLTLQQQDYKNWGKIFKQRGLKQLSTYRQNTNYALLESSLSAVNKRQQQAHPSFALVLGDFLAHNLRANYEKYTGDKSQAGYESFIKKMMQFLIAELKKNLATTDVYLAMGNNDSYTGDYSVVPKGQFFQDMATLWSPMINNTANKNSFVRDFPTGGYYTVLIPKTHHRIIVMNSVLFSAYASSLNLADAAWNQLNWLDAQLNAARKNHEQVWLAMHIPMGIDVYTTLNSKWRSIITFWQEAYNLQLKEILNKHADIVTAILPAHIHKDALQTIVLDNNVAIPVTYTPSISPIYRNNPGFKVYEYDDSSFKIKNFNVYYLALNTHHSLWAEEYNFNHQYQSDCNHCDLVTGMKQMMTQLKLSHFLDKYYMLGVDPNIATAADVYYYQCALNHLTYTSYKNCLKEKMPYKLFLN